MTRLLSTIVFMCLYIPALQAQQVNIYSARSEALIKPLLDRFSADTGITVNLITGDADALIKRLEIEGVNSPADLLLTVDVARLYRAKEAGLLQAVQSSVLTDNIPAEYRDSAGYWFGVSRRARVIVYSKERVKPEQLSTYEALADPVWKGKICVRSSTHVYNQSLVASMIAGRGTEATGQWAEGFVANLARDPNGGDRDQVKAIAAGQCDIALINTYYLAGMLTSDLPEETEAAAAIGLFWPNQGERGAHINISGAGVTHSAKNIDAAVRLLEYMVNEDSQFWYAETNHEFPVRPGVEASNLLKQWGSFSSDTVPLEQLGVHNSEAVRLMDRAGWK